MITIGIRQFPDVEHLEKLVIHLATEYDLGNPCLDFDDVDVSDPEYDDLYRELKALKPQSEAFEGTSPSTVTPDGDIVVHDPPMTSIAKADGDKKKDIYLNWLKDCAARLGSKITVAQTYKHDGVAIRINYEKGKLVSAGLRPRGGIEGSDVTRHMKYIEGVPQMLSEPLTLSLNGELECRKSVFKKINEQRDKDGEEPYKNPRNYTAGCMGREDAKEIKDSGISVSFYSITGFDEWQDHYKTEIERAKWVNQKHGLGLGNFVQVRLHKAEDLQKMEDAIDKLDFEVDGVVLKINNLEDQEQLGHHGDDPVKEPRGALAWKFAEETAIAVVKELQWNASRTGRVVPKAIFENSVDLADTEVSMATCNNYGWAEAMGVGPGAHVEVKKAGKIIPNVVRVVKQVDSGNAPDDCPSCGQELELVLADSGCKDLMCTNDDCGAKHIKAWVFYLQTLGAKGLGESAMEKILNSGKAHSLPDLYELSIEDLVAGGFSSRQAHLALCTIHHVGRTKRDDDELIVDILAAKGQKKKFQAWQFFAALGIPGAGKTAGKTLIDEWQSFDRIVDATVNDLMAVEGIGPTTAEAIYKFFQAKKDMIQNLLGHVELELPKQGKLSGTTFVLTGSFDQGKKYYEGLIQDAGGKTSSSVGSKTNYLLLQNGKTDGSPSTKEKAASSKGVPIISVQDLENML